jgi:hypothetical protein
MRRYTLADISKEQNAMHEKMTAEGTATRDGPDAGTARWMRRSVVSVQHSSSRAIFLIHERALRPLRGIVINRGLLAIRPNPDHNEFVEFEGKRYRCKYYKYYKIDHHWFRNWEVVDT